MSSIPKIPFIVKTISKYGDRALKPFITKDKYYGPLVSRRKQAVMRKKCIINGTYGEFIPNQGGWNPKWDKFKKMFCIRPNKGHKHERTRLER